MPVKKTIEGLLRVSLEKKPIKTNDTNIIASAMQNNNTPGVGIVVDVCSYEYRLM